ncbi:High mobility group superfamily [Penicillium paradoxum]|uniref:High mobility group superfamily n=1 Tax=Penicillium paradoxum TaxID=176176 RepID=UPI002547527A|nr:High mobility group superfamily [Penicillium paradoxum]KAJ5794199.1 High mobility group superfamily [Penicillium paradoxum]
MTCQAAARGSFLRTLHLSAHSRPTGVIGRQNQLRHICLAANSGLTRPQAPALCSIQWRPQSNSFATSPNHLETTKAPRTEESSDKGANGKHADDNSTKKKKKPLTEKQKEKRAAHQRKLQIDQLKVTALTPPKKLPPNFFSLAIAEKISEMKDLGQYKPGEAFTIAATQAKSLSAQDEERLKAQAEKNRAANTAAYKAWIQSHTPLQIKEANAARRFLSRLVKKDYRNITDDRLVKAPSSRYALYLKERLSSGEYQAQTQKEAFGAIAKTWNELAESEKEHYHRLHVEDRARYEREHQEVYGIPAPKQAQEHS